MRPQIIRGVNYDTRRFNDKFHLNEFSSFEAIYLAFKLKRERSFNAKSKIQLQIKKMRNINAEPAFFKNYLDSKPFSENYRFTGSSSTIFSISSPNLNIN
jgi:hypothetical protein